MAVEDTCDFTSCIRFLGHIYLLQKRGEVFLLLLRTLGVIGLGDLKDPHSAVYANHPRGIGEVALKYIQGELETLREQTKLFP
ncbi:MAG: hypothetical protein GX489_01285 [Firmicutes bacterium]|nr:hypothetical protein [Bacillota bacterium]